MAEYNESQINSNETERISAEQQRINNEAQRQTKETEREAREATRQSNESTRVSKEAERLAEEVNRQEAEASRVTAENSRGIRLTELENEVNALGTELRGTDAEIQNDVSEIQNDMTNAQTQTYSVTDSYKFTVDHDGMMPSLVTLDNIEGLSSVETNISRGFKFLLSREINHVCTINTDKNYFDDAVQDSITSNTTFTKEGNTVRVSGTGTWNAVRFNLPNLEEGKKYCILCDNVTVTSGDSVIQVGNTTRIEYQTDYLRSTAYMDESSFNRVFLVNDTIPSITLHCSPLTTGGDVTYENIQIYEVKEMIVPDIQLNSLPNGVKDEIKDGMLIKKTGIVNLADLTWTCSADQPTFAMFFSKDIPNMKMSSAFDAIDNNILCNMFKNSSTSILDDPNKYSENIINSHWSMSELKIKISKNDCPSHDDLNAWLRNNNVRAVYELATPEYIPVNLTIKADKGDTAVINTTKTMDLTYDIQLNTRAQIDALQERNAFINQFETFNIVKNGYYVLPGGLMLQWGTFSVYFGDAPVYWGECNYNIPFKTAVFGLFIDTNGFCSDAGSTASSHNVYSIAYQNQLDKFKIEIKSLTDVLPTGTIFLSWFAIGY